jgi:hypothetical protein
MNIKKGQFDFYIDFDTNFVITCKSCRKKTVIWECVFGDLRGLIDVFMPKFSKFVAEHDNCHKEKQA